MEMLSSRNLELKRRARRVVSFSGSLARVRHVSRAMAADQVTRVKFAAGGQGEPVAVEVEFRETTLFSELIDAEVMVPGVVEGVANEVSPEEYDMVPPLVTEPTLSVRLETTSTPVLLPVAALESGPVHEMVGSEIVEFRPGNVEAGRPVGVSPAPRLVSVTADVKLLGDGQPAVPLVVFQMKELAGLVSRDESLDSEDTPKLEVEAPVPVMFHGIVNGPVPHMFEGILVIVEE